MATAKGNRVACSVYLTPDNYAAIDAIAARKDVPVAQVLREAVSHYLETQGATPRSASVVPAARKASKSTPRRSSPAKAK